MLAPPSKAIRSKHAVREGLPCRQPRLQWHRGYDLPGNPQHSVVDTFRIAFSRKILLETDPIPAVISFRSKGLGARAAMRPVTDRCTTAGDCANAAIFVPLLSASL